MIKLAHYTTIGLFLVGAMSSTAFAGEDTSLKGWASDAGTYISGEMRYPRMAIQRHEEGAPQFKVTIDRDGRVLSTDIIQRSWGSTINRAAKRVLKKAEFPDLPATFEGEQLTFALTMRYALADSEHEYRLMKNNAGRVSTQHLAAKDGPLTASIMIFDTAD